MEKPGFGGVRPMTAITTHRRQAILRQAAGYLELGELLVDGTAPIPPAARKLLLRSLETLRELPEQARSGPAASLIEGEALRALGDWDAALPPLYRAVESDPGRPEAWLGIGWCLKRLGRLSEAITALGRGLESSPQEPILLYNLACYHSLAGNVPAAIEHLTKAISIDDRFRDLSDMERDFDPIRGDPRFVAVTHVTV